MPSSLTRPRHRSWSVRINSVGRFRAARPARCQPEPQDALAHARVRKEMCDLLIEARNDRCRSTGRRHDGKPAVDHEARQRLADGGQVLHAGKAPFGADGDAAQLAGLDEGVRRGDGRDHQLDGSRCGILQHLGGRPVGHFDHLHGSAFVHELAGDHAEAARGVNGVGKLAGLRLGIDNQLRKRLHRQIGMDCDDERPAVADHGHCVCSHVSGRRAAT